MMIKLSDVSTSKLQSKILNRYKDWYYRFGENSKEAIHCLETLEIFENQHIENYQDLKCMLELFETSKFFQYIKNDLKNVERKIAEANSLGIEPEIYAKELDKEINVDNRVLYIADKETMGDVLLMSNPLRVYNTKQRILSFYSIADIKFLLSHLQSDLRNEFRFGTYYYSKEDTDRLVQLIKFYNEQVERQAKEFKGNGKKSTNVFYINREEKQSVVESQLNEIAEYLIESGNLFIWGTLSDSDKIRLLNLINKPHHFAKKNFINAISNYMTLSELEQGVVKKKTLDRFIIR